MTKISLLAKDQPKREYERATKEQIAKENRHNVFLSFSSGSFKYDDRFTGKKVSGKMNLDDYASHVNALIAKARENAKMQNCELWVSEGFHTVIHEDYRK